MVHIFVRHKVADYSRWKQTFDDHLQMRKQAGETYAHLFQSIEDPRELYLLFEWDSLKNARAFMASEELRTAMQTGGVLGTPEVTFVEPAATVRRTSAD